MPYLSQPSPLANNPASPVTSALTHALTLMTLQPVLQPLQHSAVLQSQRGPTLPCTACPAL